MIRQIESPVIEMPRNDFVLAIKKDTDHVLDGLNIAQEDHGRVRAAYDRFCERLGHVFEDAFGENFELHIFDDASIKAYQIEKASPFIKVSLDPYVSGDDIFSLGVSRHFKPDGVSLIGLDARPGFASLDEQIASLSSLAAGQGVSLIEDDIFSGFTILKISEKLRDAGIMVKMIVPGIQIGDVSILSENGIDVHPVHCYKGTDAQMKRIDLADYRDFLLGADGLVIQHETHKSRIPFLLPFTSPHIRTGMPLEKEKEFSFKVWQLNAEFFEETGLKAKHMNPFSIKALEKIASISDDTAMLDIVMHFCQEKNLTA